MLGVRQVAEEDQEVQQVRVPPGHVEQLQPLAREADLVPQLGEAVGQERQLHMFATEESYPGAIHEDVGHHQPEDEPQDDPGVVVQGQALGPPDEPLEGRHGHPHDDQHVESVHRGPQPEVEYRPQELLQAGVVVYSVEEEVQSSYLEDEEAPPDQGVQQAGVPVVRPSHPGVAQEPGDETDSALKRVGETVDPLRP
jgi:hypothetical protein